MKCQENEILLSFEDVKAICRKSKKFIFWGGALGTCLAGFFALMQPIQYTSKGTFFEKGKAEAQMSMDSLAAGFLRGETKERPGKTTIKSRKILESVVHKLDLQAVLKKESPLPRIIDKLASLVNVIPKNLHTEYALLTMCQEPMLDIPDQDIVVKSIQYGGEVPLSYQLEFISNRDFVIKEAYKGAEIGKGQLDKPFHNTEFTFTLQATTTQPLKGDRYQFNLYPLGDLALKLSKNLKISTDYDSKSFLDLTLKYPTRNGVSTVLNAIMDGYREYLLGEHHKLVAAQVDYLHTREKEIDRQTAKLIEEQALYLSAPIHNLELLVSTQQSLNKKLLSNELKLKQLQNENHENSWLYSIDDDSRHLDSIQNKINELQLDRQQSDAIIAALDKLSQQNQRIQSKNLAKERIDASETEKLTKPFEGIDLETSKTLYSSYTQELHEIEGQMAQYQLIASEVQLPTFELSSLSAILKDNISQGIIGKANEIASTLKDPHNRTAREIERLERDLILQKNLLATHLEQTNERLSIRYDLLKSQTYSIQQSMVGLLKDKIQMGEKHLSDLLTASIDGLKHEEQIIRQQQKELQLELVRMPQQLVSEKLVQLHLEANGIILQQIGNLIETKNIADILDITLSAPFDRALPPIHPNSPHLLLFMAFGAVLGSFTAFCGLLTSSVMNGITASKENLLAAGQHVSGDIFNRINMNSSGNIDTLRRLTSYLCPKAQTQNIILLILGNGRDYSAELAELLSKRNQKVVIISTTFDSIATPEDQPGLLQCLEKISTSPKIISARGFDRIAAGGTTPYGSELLKSESFNNLLQQLEKQYDWVILTSKVMPVSAEAEELLTDYDHVAITISDEKLQDLQKIYFANTVTNKTITYLTENY